MENILHTLFFIFTFAYNFITVVPQAYSANNPAFEDFSRISGDTLKTSHGSIIYSAVVFRHGDRTPVFTYPTDPYKNYPWPQGYMQLTNQGKLRLNKVGQYFKGRYNSLTGQAYDHKKVKVNSADVDRCIQSGESLLSGYFPPTPPEVWDPFIYWQPIPIHTTPKEYDNIIEMSKKCPLYNQQTTNFYKTSPKIKKICNEYTSFLNYIAKNSGIPLLPCSQGTFAALHVLQDILRVEKIQFNLTLPSWTDAVYPEPLNSVVGQTFDIEVDDPEIKKLQTGPFFQQLISEMKQKSKNNDSIPMLHLFAGHDSTLVTLMRALNVYNDVLPAYGSGLAFELRKKDGNNYVTLIYENATEIAPYIINLPKCGTHCTLQKFESITSSLIPQNWDSECNSGGTSNGKSKQSKNSQSSQKTPSKNSSSQKASTTSPRSKASTNSQQRKPSGSKTLSTTNSPQKKPSASSSQKKPSSSSQKTPSTGSSQQKSPTSSSKSKTSKSTSQQKQTQKPSHSKSNQPTGPTASNVPQAWTPPTNQPQNSQSGSHPSSGRQQPATSSPPIWQSAGNVPAASPVISPLPSNGNLPTTFQSFGGIPSTGGNPPSTFQSFGGTPIWPIPPIGFQIDDDISFNKHGNMSFNI